MRLEQIRELLAVNIPLLEAMTVESVPQVSPPHVRLSNLIGVRQALKVLAQIQRFEPLVATLAAGIVFQADADVLITSQEVGSAFSGPVSQIRALGRQLVDIINQFIPKQDPVSLSIKLPESDSLVSLVEVVKELNLVFNGTCIQVLGEEIKFGGFDVGTSWLILVLPRAVLGFVLKLLDAVQRYRFENRRLNWIEQQVRLSKIVVDNVDNLKTTVDSLLGEFRHSLSNEIVESTVDAQRSAETTARVADAIERMFNLIERGVEVHRQLDAPEAISKALPEPITKKLRDHLMLPAHDTVDKKQEKPDVA